MDVLPAEQRFMVTDLRQISEMSKGERREFDRIAKDALPFWLTYIRPGGGGEWARGCHQGVNGGTDTVPVRHVLLPKEFLYNSKIYMEFASACPGAGLYVFENRIKIQLDEIPVSQIYCNG